MPAEALGFGRTSPRERVVALVAVSLVQLALALALLSGFRVQLSRPADVVERLIEVALPKAPPLPVPIVRPQARPKAARQPSSAPKAEPDRVGGSPGPQPARALPVVSPIVTVQPSAPAPGGGSGSGPALGSGAGGGAGGSGYGDSAMTKGAPISNRSPGPYCHPIILAAFAKAGSAGGSNSSSRSEPTAG